MPLLSRPKFGPQTALTYVTIGALLVVWSGVWYIAFRDPDAPFSRTTFFWLVGLFLTGVTFIVLGLVLGPLGQRARQAELPPREAVASEARIQETAAATPQTTIPPVPGAGVIVQQPSRAPASGQLVPQAPEVI